MRFATGSLVRILAVVALTYQCCMPAARADFLKWLGKRTDTQQNDFSGDGLTTLLKKTCSVSAATKRRGDGPIFTSPSKALSVLEAALKQLAASGPGQPEPDCDPKYKPALEALKELLADEVLEDICSPLVYDRIRSFHERFIHFYVPELGNEELRERKEAGLESRKESIPEALREFFIIFAKQINGACKQSLVQRLKALQDYGPTDGSEFLSEKDFSVISLYNTESYRLNFMNQLSKSGLGDLAESKPNEFNKIKLAHTDAGWSEARLGARTGTKLAGPGEQAEAEHEFKDDGSKLYLKVGFGDALRRVKVACERRFRPVYMELFASAVKLGNLGYIDTLRSSVEDRNLEEDPKLNRWSEIIQICEALRDIEIMEDSTDISAIVGLIQMTSHLAQGLSISGDRVASKVPVDRGVNILTADKARELSEMVRKSRHKVIADYNPEQLVLAHKPTKFTPRMWITESSEVRREVKDFENRVESTVSRQLSVIRQWLKNGRNLVNSFMGRNIRAIREGENDSTAILLLNWLDKHRFLLMFAGFTVSVIFLMIHLAPFAG